jgi:hypothetical protein
MVNGLKINVYVIFYIYSLKLFQESLLCAYSYGDFIVFFCNYYRNIAFGSIKFSWKVLEPIEVIFLNNFTA